MSALNKGDIKTMKKCLNKEEELRRDFLKYRIPAASSRIISIARNNDCGIKFVGGGGGGCLWILGEEQKIIKIKEKISHLKTAKILPFNLDHKGVDGNVISLLST